MSKESKFVEHALSLILNDPHFIASPTSSAFLSYIVSTSLKGNGNRLKAHTIAVEALGKPDSFDPQNDPTVRALASRVRETLELYNAKPNSASIEISIKIGSYTPCFKAKHPAAT